MADEQQPSVEEVQLRAWRNHELRLLHFNRRQRSALIARIESGELYLEHVRHLIRIGASVDEALLIEL